MIAKNTGQETLEIMKNASYYNNWILSFFKDYLNGEIIEIGGGIGNFTSLLINYGKVTSIEIEKSYLPKISKATRNRAESGFGDIEKDKYFFGDKKFNVAVMLNVLEHIKDDASAIRNTHKLLKKKGFAIILVPAHQLLYSKLDENLGHYRRYTKTTLNKLLKQNGFKILSSRYLNVSGMVGWLINGRVLKKEIIPNEQLKFFDFLFRPALFAERFIEFPLGLSVMTIAQKQ